MSMISAQCDELRKAAQTYRMFGGYEMEQTLLDAADTIWELRDDLQRANAAVQEAEHDESMAWDRVRKAEAESTKLREYIERKRDLQDFARLVDENSELRKLVRGLVYATHPADRARLIADAAELGIEVDE